MMRLLPALILAITLGFGAVPASAKGPEDVRNLVDVPAQLDPDKAYLLFDSSRAKSGMFAITHVFLRIPGAAEMADYRKAKEAAYAKALPKLRKKAKDGVVPTIDQFPFEHDGAPNTFAVDMGKALAIGDGNSFLIEVPAGTYVLYGVAVNSRALATCNCLGTVKFAAGAGKITQLGSLYADKVHEPSDVPNLEDNLGEKMSQYGFVLGQALVPAKAGNPIPAELVGLPHQLATFEPVGAFREPGAAFVNRLAPIPGILEYDRGRVVLSPE